MDRIISTLNQISYKKIIWVLAITETLHNLEEAIWLPAWSKTIGIWHPMVGEVEFQFAVTILTFMFYGVIYYFWKYENKLSKYLMGGALIVILFNVFIPHLIAAIFTLNYAPGVGSGILLNLPVCIFLLRRGLKEGFFNTKTLILGGGIFTLIILPLLQLLFVIGRIFDGII